MIKLDDKIKDILSMGIFAFVKGKKGVLLVFILIISIASVMAFLTDSQIDTMNNAEINDETGSYEHKVYGTNNNNDTEYSNVEYGKQYPHKTYGNSS